MILNEIINLKDRKELLKRKFFWIYPFTNENIKAYYSNIDFKQKEVLTVTSSGDHILNAILYGAKEVSGFDLNPLAKYYTELKIAAIKSLSLEEFIMFFYNKKFTTYKYYLNKKTYIKIRDNLKKEYQEFWDFLFIKYTKRDIEKSYLFTDDYLNLKAQLEINPYLTDDNYYKLRDLLKEKNVTYYDINIKDFDKIKKQFDIIILSNIPAHLENIYDKDILKSFKKSIDYVSHKNSKVVVNYFYDNLLDYTKDKIIYNEKKVSEFFIDEEYEYKCFESSFNTGMAKGLRLISNNYDQVLISKDKK